MSVREPLLASREVSGDEYGRKVRGWFGVFGGLNYIRGNSSPHFTITAEVHQKGYPDRFWSGGADHEGILHYFPRFADLVRLHLCDMDGAPMHAVANGWYDLAGALGGAGEKYHRGNSETYGRLDVTPNGCLQMFADHLRIPLERAEAIRTEFASRTLTGKAAVERLIEIVDELRPGWKVEADAAIAKYGLVIFGDTWPVLVSA